MMRGEVRSLIVGALLWACLFASPSVAAGKKLAMVLGVIGESKEEGGAGFAAEYYLPYFRALAAEKLAEAFAYVAMQSSGSADVKEWLTNNRSQIEKLLVWSKNYAWPSPKL